MIEPATVSESLSAAGLDPMPATPEAETTLQTPSERDCEAVCATRYAVVSSDVVRLVLSDDFNPLAAIILAPAEVIGLTADLLAAARVRVGRPAINIEVP